MRISKCSLPAADDDRFKSFDDYAKYAKANPGKVSIAVAGDGGIEMMAVALVNNALGIETKYIPFDKFSDRMAAFLGGHTDLMVEEPGDTLAMRKEGRMRALLIMADKRADALPGVPTAKEKGRRRDSRALARDRLQGRYASRNRQVCRGDDPGSPEDAQY